GSGSVGPQDTTNQADGLHLRRSTEVERQARQLRAANDCIDAARRLATEIDGATRDDARTWLHHPDHQNPHALLALFSRHDLWRRPEQLNTLLQAALRLADESSAPATLLAAAEAARAVDTGQIARQHASQPAAIRAAIDAARAEAIGQALGMH
ncbi:MAG: hypothetical protein Q4D91_14650, partial [Lautropia sp.]|nr:hypothetical protein [Lautropia sp.]